MHLNPASTAFISEMFGLPVMNFSFCFEQIKCETAMIWKMDHPKLIWCCVIVKMYSWFTAWQAWWRASVTDLINEKASYKGMDFTSWVNRHRFLSYFFPINLFFSFPASVLGGEKKKSFCLCLFFSFIFVWIRFVAHWISCYRDCGFCCKQGLKKNSPLLPEMYQCFPEVWFA